MHPPGLPDGGTPARETAPGPVVVMGVSGVGKTVVGVALAARLAVPYADADDLHDPASVAKMRGGTPLTDDDRLPWLERVGRWLHLHEPSGGVMSCSALKRSYRQVLVAAAPTVRFLHLTADEAVLTARMQGRAHFMPAALLASQLATLEPLAPEEPGLAVDASQPVHAVVEEFLRRTAARG